MCWLLPCCILILRLGHGSSSNAFNMIAIWITFCILIPGAVHQYVSKVPVGYMTDFLGRKSSRNVCSIFFAFGGGIIAVVK